MIVGDPRIPSNTVDPGMIHVTLSLKFHSAGRIVSHNLCNCVNLVLSMFTSIPDLVCLFVCVFACGLNFYPPTMQRVLLLAKPNMAARPNKKYRGAQHLLLT